MIFLTFLAIATSSTIGGAFGFFIGDKRRKNIDRDKHYEDLIKHLSI